MYGRAGIRLKILAAFLGVVLFTAGVAGLGAILVSRDTVTDQAIAHLESVASLKESELKSWTRNLSIELMGLAEQGWGRRLAALAALPSDSREFKTEAKAIRERFRQTLAPTQRLEELYLLSASGKVLVSSNPIVEGEFRGAQEYFAAGLREPGIHVQTTTWSSASEPLNAMIVVIPVRDAAGRTAAVLCGRASANRINLLMSDSTGLGQTGETYLVAGNNVLMSATRFKASAPSATAAFSLGLEEALQRHRSGWGIYRNAWGNEVVGVYRWLPELKVALMAEQDKAEILQPVYRTLRVIGITVVLAVIAASVAAVLFTRTLARPLVELATIAGRIAGGELELAADIRRQDEIGSLAQAFNTMTMRLRELIADLSRRLDELESTQQALRSSEARYRSIFENALEGVFQTTPEGRFLSINPALVGILGYDSEAELLAMVTDISTQCYANPSDREEMLRQLRENDFVKNYLAEFRRKDGSVLWGMLNLRAIRDENGALRHLEGIFTDMTERKRFEKELAELNRHLEQLVVERTADIERKARELEEANRQLLELDELKSAFLSSVSHELRTPLTSILGFAKLIDRDFIRSFMPLSKGVAGLESKSERIHANLAIIEREGERLTRLINDFLDLTKIEAGRVDWKDALYPASTLLQQALEAVHSLVGRNPEVKLEVDIPPDLPAVFVDADRLEQLVINILTNAWKFTERGFIRISASHDAQSKALLVQVADSGLGIPASDLNKIFDKFHQVRRSDTVSDKPKGTGLGLAICRQIVDHYKGRIWVESEPGQGSVFSFELPAAVIPETESEIEVSEALVLPAGAPRILVVDDDAAVRQYLSQIFQDEGYAPVTAADGAEALEKARQYAPSLITMDLIMPNMGGEEAIRQLRNDPELGSIPILVISVLQEGQVKGVDASLRKPIDPDQVLDAVHGLLSGCNVSRPILVLRRNGPERLGSFFALCEGNIDYCDEEQLWRRLAAGFRGTVVLPAWAARTLDIARLSVADGVNVLLMPEAPEQS